MADWKPPVFEGEIKNYTPTLRDRITYGISGLMSGRGELGPDRESMTRARMIANALDYTPVGIATGIDDATRATGRGDYAAAGMDLAMAGVPGPPVKGLNRLETGWTFKDVKSPNPLMQKGDWRKRNRASDTGDWEEVELPIRSMYATQATVGPDFANAAPHGELPLVIKKDGQYFVQDGHHRITAAADRGKQTAKVRLIDLDGTPPTESPLLEWRAK